MVRGSQLLLFPLLNPAVEELQYRGYAQPRLIVLVGSPAAGVAWTAVLFGLQHMAFATTPVGAVAFAVGYMLWGAGAGVIVHRQGRLAQVLVAHVISNLVPAAIPLVSLALR
jgi:uncharacterized protein